ncbi:CDP-diacylglycerol--glycerol-3-phosphate 3-phosphatidyltransferase [Ruania alba]|uniref:CDP-diacylglycerol--glycerol-3-phosphate 3-phosphatidyltransferase n=1 Tax=Ruania alba TaxID=648782 RepID=A0A1H5E549_9MICO|nr:CDP-diacylglycerol--glycerol-3-phosphate 3-phosphatidyltransferase [Ruania alba]SED86229.1 CDP-diacylglycerol--glycerol-3-phosphate 3-phosphatidyltransferase [Ruania alba]
MTSNAETPSAQPAAQLWNLPNVLTMLRVVLVPVFVVLLWQDSTAARLGALGVFIAAAITDKLDGSIARSRGIVTNFGKIADPFADKLLTGSAFVMLSLLGVIPWWVTIVILVREIGITILRFVMVRRSVMAASNGGKLKTVLQVVAICLLLLSATELFGPPLGDVVLVTGLVVVYAAAAVTVVTGLDYCWRAWRIVHDHQP